MSAPAKVSCNHLWKIFSSKKKRIPLPDPALSKAEILKQTGMIVAIKDVSFQIQSGEIFVVMGLSGSGKSTLIRCISRLVEPTFGEVYFDGENVTKMNKRQLRETRRHKMSMVFQHFGLFPHRKVIENMTYGLEIQGVEKSAALKRARHMLELVGLTGWENHYPSDLSGGMQQRVGLARALAVDPELLLCDEPFSALDPLIRRDMQQELLRLQQQVRKTMLFITHDFLEAIKLGDRIGIMKDGELIQVGTAEEIVSHPINEYVREFTQDVPRARVLTARSVMKPLTAAALEAAPGAPRAPLDTRLEQLIQLSAGHTGPVVIVDAENTPVGYIDQDAVLKALAGKPLDEGPFIKEA